MTMRTLQYGYAGPVVVLGGGGAVFDERGTPAGEIFGLLLTARLLKHPPQVFLQGLLKIKDTHRRRTLR